MSARFLLACLTSAALLLVGSSFPVAAERPAKARLVTKVYPVADLVIPFDNSGACVVDLTNAGEAFMAPLNPAPTALHVSQPMPACPSTCTAKNCPTDVLGLAPAPAGTCPPVCPSPSQPAVTRRTPTKTTEDTLMTLVTNTVAPQSWSKSGGEGRVDYFPPAMAMVVTQTADVQEQVSELLDALRRLQDVEVALELRFVTVTDKCFERASRELGLEPRVCETAPRAASAKVAFLNDRQVQKFMDVLQDNRQTSVMQAPKLTVFNGTESMFRIAESQFFVTSVHSMQAGGQHVFVPENKPISYGFEFALRPAVSADRRFVKLSLSAAETSISQVDLFPVTTYITPVFEGGAVGQPVPFTQFIQQPRLTNLSMHKSFCVPDGGTLLLSGWKPLRAPSTEEKPLFVQVLDMLCPPPASAKETETVVVMVTPRIIVNENDLERLGFKFNSPNFFDPATMRPGLANYTHESATVLDILARYQQACSAGRLAEAKELAKKALAIDPACFSQNLPKKEQERNESR